MDMQRRIRQHIFLTQKLQRQREYGSSVQNLSPALQGELAIFRTEKWINKVCSLGCVFICVHVMMEAVAVAVAVRFTTIETAPWSSW